MQRTKDTGYLAYTLFIDDLDGTTIDLSHWDENLDNWWHALLIFELINTYLTGHYLGSYDLATSFRTGSQYDGIEHMEESEISLGLMHDTGWKTFIAPDEYLLDRDDEVARWSVSNVLRRTTPDEPHITCFLADRAPLRDDWISTAEMRTILVLSGVRAMDSDHHHRKLIPVTVISGSGKQVRIVVGVVNSGKASIEVRRSPIVDLSKGVEGRKREWLAILCWISGSPSGRTT